MGKINRTVLHSTVPTITSAEQGGIVRSENDLFLHNGNLYRYVGVLPSTVPPFSDISTLPNWVLLSDSGLRSTLLSTYGASVVNTNSGVSVQSELDSLSSSINTVNLSDYTHLVGDDGDYSEALKAALSTGKDVFSAVDITVKSSIITKGQRILGSFNITSTKDASSSILGPINTSVAHSGTTGLKGVYVERTLDLFEFLHIKKLGFNTLIHYTDLGSDVESKVIELLDTAKSAGLKVVVSVDKNRTTSLINRVRNTYEHESTLGYTVFDEPAARGISVEEQDSAIQSIKSITNKPVFAVDIGGSELLTNTSRWSRNYDVFLAEAYSGYFSSGTVQERIGKDLMSCRLVFAYFKTILSDRTKVVPCIGTFLSNSGYHSDDIAQVQGTALEFAKAGNGDFACFVWDGYGDVNITDRLQSNVQLRDLCNKLCSVSSFSKYETEVISFGPGFNMTSAYKGIHPLDASATRGKVELNNPYPVTIRKTSTWSNDRTSPYISNDITGLGFKGGVPDTPSTFRSTMQLRKNVRLHARVVCPFSALSGYIRLVSFNDDGVLGFNVLSQVNYTNASGIILADIPVQTPPQNSGSGTPRLGISLYNDNDRASSEVGIYRVFLQGLLVSTDW